MSTKMLMQLVIEGTAAGAVRALGDVQNQAKATTQALSRMDLAAVGSGRPAGAAGAVRALGDVQNQAKAATQELSRMNLVAADSGRLVGEMDALAGGLQSIKSGAAGLFAFAGIGLGADAVVQLADAFNNMAGRLRVATQYTGDFDNVLGMLRDSAASTRADLQGTVDLYVKMSPALQGIGYSAQDAVAVITTINHAIGVSGASSEAAAAALMQLGQGFGSGVLRGEELNSVLEQTPMLAQAIADGLGVPIGELRKLGEQGDLTASKVAGALKKVAPDMAATFASMPVTVGQAITALKNELLVFVGATDQVTGGSSALANVIAEVAAAFRDGHPILSAFTESLKVLANGLEGTYRLLKVTGMGLAGYAAMAQRALVGDMDGVRAIWQALGQDIEDVLMKPLVTAPRAVAAAGNVARERERLEAQLAVQVEKLENQKRYIAEGTANAVVASAKSAVDAQIADQQRLVDAVRAAWSASLAEADKARQKAESLRDQASDRRLSSADRATQIREAGLSDEQRQANDRSRGRSALARGMELSERAAAAQLAGESEKFERYTAQAEKFLERAMRFAESGKDAGMVERAGEALARSAEAAARAEEQKAKAAESQATALAGELNDLQFAMDELQKKAREIEVSVDVQKAQENIAALESRLAALPDSKESVVTASTDAAVAAIGGVQSALDGIQDKTVTVTVNTVHRGGSPSAGGDDLPARAYGGPLPGWAPSDRADNVIYRGTPGEWVIQRPAVRYYGAGLLAAINAMRLPRFANGGEIGASLASRLRVPGVLPQADRSPLVGATFDLGSLGTVPVTMPKSDHDALAHRLAIERLKRGGRR